ncbi:MAG: MarR family transcriptional regulator [Ruminococcus sp.]|nr:MarR family transcriptional regulator [Ruminococcus sp.]
MITEKYLSELCKSYYDLKYSLFKVVEVMCKDEGLTVLQTMMLFLIRSEGNVSVGDLSNYFNITHSNASTLCKKLEKDDLLTRKRSHADERTVLIGVTDKGSQTLERMLDRGKVLAESMKDIPQERLDFILTTMNEATELLSSLRS